MNNPPLSLYIELNIFASPFNEDKVYISSQRKHAPLWPYYKKTYFIVFTKVSWDIHLLWYYETFVSKVIYKKICFVTFWLLIFALRKRKTSFLVYLKSSNNSFLVLDSIYIISMAKSNLFISHFAIYLSITFWTFKFSILEGHDNNILLSLWLMLRKLYFFYKKIT